MTAVLDASPQLDASINPRVASLNESKTMVLTDLARALREAGQDVIGLAAGEPDFDTPAAIVEAGVSALRYLLQGPVRSLMNKFEAIHHRQIQGPSFRFSATILTCQENGLDYRESDIVISNGAKQSVWQAIMATVSPGDEVRGLPSINSMCPCLLTPVCRVISYNCIQLLLITLPCLISIGCMQPAWITCLVCHRAALHFSYA